MKYVLSKCIYLIGRFVLRSFLSQCVRPTGFPVGPLQSVSFQALTTLYLAFLSPISGGSMGWFGVGTKEQNKPKKIPDTTDLCCICSCSPSGPSLPEVGTPSCWNQSFGKQECPMCQGCCISLHRSFLNWCWGRKKTC